MTALQRCSATVSSRSTPRPPRLDQVGEAEGGRRWVSTINRNSGTISRHQDVKHLPGQRTGWRRSSCQRFVRDRATRDLAPAHYPTLGSTSHLRGCAGTRGAARHCEPSAHRWQGWGRRFDSGGGLHTRLTSGNAGEWPTGAIAADHLCIGRDAPGLSAPRGSGAAAPTPTRWAATAPASPTPPARRSPCAAAGMRGSPPGWPTGLRLAVLAADDRLFGLELEHLSVDGCITKAPCGGQTAGPSPTDRRKQGLKRSIVTDAGGIPLGRCPPRPTAATTGCWRPPSTPSAWSGPCRPGRWCTWTPATTTSPAGRSWPSAA
jgi:hypothetical protein